MRVVLTSLVVFVLLAQSACSVSRPQLPRVHKVTVQQGNVITQEMIDRLRPGMTRSQVAFVMGEPVFRNPFDDRRWDYVYTLEVPGIYQDTKRMSLFFEDGVLSHFSGDYAPTAAKQADQDTASSLPPAATPES
ncbi:MAG: outer membrane protein assembly factor BamE [Pseudomonadales bacterium]